jgi:hypothetical protein
MSLIALSNNTVLVNDIPQAIVPNSVSYKVGYGEVTVRSATVGGGAKVSVHSENAENAIGYVKFEMYVTEDARASIKAWKLQLGLNRVQGIQTGGSPFSLNGASMTNEPEFNPTADGTVEVEFMGDPMPTL